MSFLVRIGNDELVTVEGVTDNATGNFINNAVVTMSLVDADGADVPGQVFPTTLIYVPGSDGDYSGDLQSTLVLEVSTEYTLIIDVGDGITLDAHFEIRVTAIVRSAGC